MLHSFPKQVSASGMSSWFIASPISGTVQLWSPNIREPLVKMLAHKSSVRGIAVEGNYMATTGLDRRLRLC